MPSVSFSSALQNEYRTLYKTMEIRPDKISAVENIMDALVSNKSRYEAVGDPLGVPWFVVGVIHNMESTRNFTRHLHNGDPLTARTVQYPPGRPASGTAPFTWEESATDALKLKNFHRITNWSLPRILYKLEQYNGWGYRLYHPEVFSPYLWSFCNHYTSGKYAYDGVWDSNLTSQQCGAAVIIRRMEQLNIIPALEPEPSSTIFSYSRSVEPHAEELQRFLNQFEGIALLVDGVPYKKTSEAVKKAFGFYLKGDRRS